MIDLQKNERQIDRNAKIYAKQSIILPTCAQMTDPDLIYQCRL